MKLIELNEGGPAKNYTPKGGQGDKKKWAVVLNNGKKKTVSAATKQGTKDFLSSNELIIGIKTVTQIHETVEQQRTVTNPNDVQRDKYYVHTYNYDGESAVWGPFGKDEAGGFLQHSGFDKDSDITAKVLKGRDVIKSGALKENMKEGGVQ